jgi:hypothetical protein
MAATKTASTSSRNGNAASAAARKAKEAGDSVATVARKARLPAITAGATAAGVAGGLALGARMGSKRRKILGIPIGRKTGLARTTEALGQVARELSSARNQAALATDDVRAIREELDKANRRSPLEVVLDGLTHRRGAHKRES